jgi:D-aminopeptidase
MNMKIYMHWDMEGVSGIFTREHVWYWEEEVRERIAAEGRQLLIADINSAARAALEAGVDELIVCDTHHGGENIILDQMFSDPAITYYKRIDEYTVAGHVQQQCDVVKWILGVGLRMRET